MNDEIHRHLDGEIPASELGAEEREVVDHWDRMLTSFRRSAPDAQAPAWLEQRVMAEIERLPRKGAAARAWEWLVSPAPLRVSPLAAGLVAAAFALVFLARPNPVAPPTGGPAGSVATASGDGAETVVYVQFTLEAPTATSVAVAGDFSDWQPTFVLEDPDGDGVWSGRVPVRPGVHGYMFVIDDTEWRTDPNANRYQDDGFGNRNAVLAVGSS